jgi:serine protease Do
MRSIARIALCALMGMVNVSQIAYGQTAPTAPTSSAPTTSSPQPSVSGQRLFDAARDKLMQIRILTKAGGSQATVGSGFLIDANGTAMTNYHVVSNLVMEPDRYRAEYAAVDGKRGSVKLLAFDVVHDLAVISLQGAGDTQLSGMAHFNLRPESEPLRQGEKIYSLGNPMDLGFAISEGTYNGLIERRLYETIHFTGALNPGMSGGPAVDEQGRVIGVNVARTRGELANLLVPVGYARKLIAKPRDAAPDKKAITPQLLAHQETMMTALLGKPFPRQALGPATVAVGDEKLLRCWGSSSSKEDKPYSAETTQCNLQSSLYVDSQMQTGSVSWSHTYRNGKKLGAWRFANWHSRGLAGVVFSSDGRLKPSRYRTRPHCQEDYVERAGTTMHVSMCAKAHREFDGLFDMRLTATSIDRATEGLSSQLSADGVSFANGNRLLRAFLEATEWAK